MSPRSGLTDPTGAVYVLAEFVGDRPVIPAPYTNAERPDTDLFYREGVYDLYPMRKAAYEARRAAERRKTRLVQEWAWQALEALDDGRLLPPTKRDALRVVLTALHEARGHGRTRPEICREWRRDGGKISGAMTDLHAAGIIFPLEGVRR